MIILDRGPSPDTLKVGKLQRKSLHERVVPLTLWLYGITVIMSACRAEDLVSTTSRVAIGIQFCRFWGSIFYL